MNDSTTKLNPLANHKRGLARTQTALLPAAVEDYVGKHDLVRVIDAYAEGLNMAGLGFKHAVVCEEGRPPYAPADLLKLYLYGYWNRIRASRKLEAERDEQLQQAQVELAARAGAADTAATPRVGLTDPDCVMLKTRGGATLAGYNVQQAVDSQHKLIVAHEVTTQRNDHGSLEPMASLAQEALQAESLTAITDTGYMNGAQAQACEERGITPVVPMAKVSNTRDDALYTKSVLRFETNSCAGTTNLLFVQRILSFKQRMDFARNTRVARI